MGSSRFVNTLEGFLLGAVLSIGVRYFTDDNFSSILKPDPRFYFQNQDLSERDKAGKPAGYLLMTAGAIIGYCRSTKKENWETWVWKQKW